MHLGRDACQAVFGKCRESCPGKWQGVKVQPCVRPTPLCVISAEVTEHPLVVEENEVVCYKDNACVRISHLLPCAEVDESFASFPGGKNTDNQVSSEDGMLGQRWSETRRRSRTSSKGVIYYTCKSRIMSGLSGSCCAF